MMTNCRNKYCIEDARYTLDRTTDLINNCDTKSSIALGFVGVAMGILLSDNFIPKGITIIENNLASLKFKAYLLFLCVIIIAFALGVYFLFSVIFAKINKSKYNSKIFFTDISSNKSLQDYKKIVVEQNEDEMLDDLINQIYINAEICTDKYKRYRRGIKLIVFSVLTFLFITAIFIFIL